MTIQTGTITVLACIIVLVLIEVYAVRLLSLSISCIACANFVVVEFSEEQRVSSVTSSQAFSYVLIINRWRSGAQYSICHYPSSIRCLFWSLVSCTRDAECNDCWTLFNHYLHNFYLTVNARRGWAFGSTDSLIWNTDQIAAQSQQGTTFIPNRISMRDLVGIYHLFPTIEG